MRILKRAITISIFALAFMLFVPTKSKAQDGYISDQEFYDQLAPYGTWVQDDYYGDVWIPNVDQDFRPYATDGYWAQTEYGNTWVSDYPWGGQLSITAGGIMMIIMGGNGYRATIGHQPGLAGAMAVAIMAGHRWMPV